MSKAYPIPSITQLIDDSKMFTIPFRNWFRDLSAFWNNTNSTTSGSNKTTTSQVGSICFIEYNGESGIELTLPSKPSIDSILRYKLYDVEGAFSNGTVHIKAGVGTVTLPDLLPLIVVKDWYYI